MFQQTSGAHLAEGWEGGSMGSRPLPFFDIVQIVPSNSYTNSEQTL